MLAPPIFGHMSRKPLELPPAVARSFVKDMRAFFAEKNAIKRDEIAARGLPMNGPKRGNYPNAQLQDQTEDTAVFYKRYGKKMTRSRNIAMGFARLSALFFCLGTILLLRVVAF
jgi:hypothetical protein